MSDDNYLSYKDQFKKVLNQEEISRIENFEIRKIREKYWHLKHKTFIDENNISDKDLGKVFDNICLAEQKELEAYKRK
ncbi:hypothetical protein FDB29_07255 [Clostridium botulinum]|nr:hypothetical protein [Clostridium botulinum]HBJ2622083.1 hypothetical protein [Clostridium botulinum]